MGTCLSKKSTTTTAKSTTSMPAQQEDAAKVKGDSEQPEKKRNAAVAILDTPKAQEVLRKEVFVIKHRKSHEIDRHPDHENPKSNNPDASSGISRSTTTSAGIAAVSDGGLGRAGGAKMRTSSCTKEEVDAILLQCGRLSRSSSAGKAVIGGTENPGHRRRYSGSKRSFDFDMEVGLRNDDDNEVMVVDGGDHHRHRRREPRVSSPSSSRRGSKERGNGGGRRMSRSPNRRSESPIPNSNGGGGSAASGGGGNKPAKMVSVPATEKSNNGGGEVVSGGGGGGGVRRIQVKRNVGEVAVAVGSRSLASPRARSPAKVNLRVLNENQQLPLSLSRSNSRKAEHSPYRRNPLSELDNNGAGSKKPSGEKMMNNKSNNGVVTRSRSLRLSRDLDINLETLVNPNPPSYASLLLEDIQNFHQKNTTTTTTIAATEPPAFTLPACVSKACSILEAVADLNSATRDRRVNKVNLIESEMVVNDDLMEPSLHKYVTVRRGVGAGAEIEDQESSGSNSIAASQQLNWLSSSWEPNSADSTDCLTSSSRSKSNAQDHESDCENKRIMVSYPRNGIGRGRVGSLGSNAYSMPNTTVASQLSL